MNEIELRHLRCLVTLAEERNFGRAAERLHMSQPPLTRLVSEVERIIGARLFERTTRRVALTPVGMVFVTEAQAVLARAEVARENVRIAVRSASGQLRLAYTASALQTVLPQIVSRLREREPDVSIDLVELSGDAQTEALMQGQVDMGFTDAPMNAEDFVSLRLHQEDLQVLLPGDHPLARHTALRLANLAEETLILHARHEYPHYYDRILAACEEAGFIPHVYQRKAGQNCLALVAAGQGLLFTPAKPGYNSPEGLSSLPLETTNPSLRAEVWAVFPTAPGVPALETLRDITQAAGRAFAATR